MPESVFHMLFILNEYSKFTAFSFDFAINQPLDSALNGFLSQIPTVSNFRGGGILFWYNHFLSDSVKPHISEKNFFIGCWCPYGYSTKLRTVTDIWKL